VSFHSVLIANRGEIALRIIEACRELSLDSIAVYSEADAEMPYLRLAGRAICIGPANPAKSYLSIPALLSAAEITGAEAIHPGYGFLAENPHFVEVCEDQGLTMIGPPRSVMALLGDKVAARNEVAHAGVPVLPGVAVPDDPEALERAAAEIGFPLLVKAVFGGGGRGMRWVRGPAELLPAVLAAAKEARGAFADDALYLERAVEDPRHIEVQVLADLHGRIVHLGERDCSVQRRHQKLIEEAPAPRLHEETRRRLHDMALRAAKAVSYRNAGTVEFVVHGDEEIHFVEMNARIQVEHPVTEAVTGLNLVKEQIRIARGDSLGFDQQDVAITGHAIECRINAEDPGRGFLPSCGTLHIEELPSGHGIRIDTHIADGQRVTPHYDSLLAKVIAWGRDREEARIRMYTALERFRVSGVSTTRTLAQEVISHPDFRSERIGTRFLDDLLGG